MISRPRSPRRFATGALILAVAFQPLAAQRPAPAQRGGAPRPDTPQLLVTALTSSDPALGLAASDAIQRRIQSEHNATDLYVIPRPTIVATLRVSGYNPDSALGTGDLMELARRVRGDFALAGTVERTASGVRTSIRLLTQRGQQIVAEPLALLVGSDVGDIAKQVDRSVSDALHALTFYNECMNALLTNDYQHAMAAARQGLRIRPTSPALNQCVLATLRATHAGPDSILAVASVITAADSANIVAWANLSDAYAQTGDTARALEAARVLHRLDAANVTFTSSLVDRLVGAGTPEAALAVLDTALRTEPGSAEPANAELLRKRWLLHLRLGQYADALASGNALVTADSAAATVDYFERQLGAARGAHDSASVRRLARDAAARFPRNADFLTILARDAVDRGAPREALGLVERVLSIDLSNAIAWQLAIATEANVNGADSAIVTARRALTAGVSREAVGASLVTLVTPALAAAQTSQKRADWEVVLRTAQAVDTVASSPRSMFYVGVAAYQIATDELQGLGTFVTRRSPTRAERQAACGAATRVEELVRIATIAMPGGGKVDPAIAATILGALPGMSDFVTPVKQSSCRSRPDE